MSGQRDLSETAPWLGLSALVAFAIVGIVTRLPTDLALSIPAAAVVLAAGSLMVRLRPRGAPTLGLLAGLAPGGGVAIGGGLQRRRVVWGLHPGRLAPAGRRPPDRRC